MRYARPVALGVLVVAVLAAGVLLAEDLFWLRVLTFALLLSAVAQSWNLLAGYAGQWSLAQLAFFGIGAYAAGIADARYGIPLLVGLVPAVLLTALVAAVIGGVTLRIRGHYFSLVTFLLTVSLFELVREFADYTGGQYGLSVPFRPGTDVIQLQFDSQVAYYYLAAAVATVATVILWGVSRSRVGLLLRAIRDDEDAAAALGVRTLALKVYAMSISAVMAATAGVAYLATYKLMDAETAFGIHNSLDPVVAGILGGAGVLMGGVVGEGILQPVIAEVNVNFGSIPGVAALVYGLILMAAILLIPRGILRLVGPGGVAKTVASLRNRFTRERAGVAPVGAAGAQIDGGGLLADEIEGGVAEAPVPARPSRTGSGE
jgi:branched-chain amino acid transport system permease protein